MIISATYSNQSGNSAMMRSFSPISITTEPSERGSLPAGSPGVGADPDPENYPDVYYVNGTPVMAVLYGIDIAAVKKWEAYPDMTNSLEETAKNPETQLLQEGKATISVIEASYAAGHTSEKKVKCRLQNLLHSDKQGETH